MRRLLIALLAVAAMLALGVSPASADLFPAAGTGPPIVSGSGAPQGNGQSGAHVVHCQNIPGGEDGVRVHIVATNEHQGGCDSPP